MNMDRKTATQFILKAKEAKGLTWSQIAETSSHSETWVVAALLGQATMSKEEAQSVGKIL